MLKNILLLLNGVLKAAEMDNFIHPIWCCCRFFGQCLCCRYVIIIALRSLTAMATFLAKWGSKGSDDGQFNNPRGVAVDSSGNVYVADSNNYRIEKFDSNGTFLAKWGSNGSGDGQFKYPDGVAVDSSGNVYVADTNNYRIEKFDSNGTFLTKWGSIGSGDGQFKDPYGVAVDSSGNVYVADTLIIAFRSLIATAHS